MHVNSQHNYLYWTRSQADEDLDFGSLWALQVASHDRTKGWGSAVCIHLQEVRHFTCRLLIRSHIYYRNPSVVVTRVRHDESTSNLVRHSDRCTPGATTATALISSFAHGSTYSYPKFRMKLALWVARRHRPFAIVEDDELIDIFMDLNNKVEVPSHITVSRDVKEIFRISRVKVSEILQVRLPYYFAARANNWLK